MISRRLNFGDIILFQCLMCVNNKLLFNVFEYFKLKILKIISDEFWYKSEEPNNFWNFHQFETNVWFFPKCVVQNQFLQSSRIFLSMLIPYVDRHIISFPLTAWSYGRARDTQYTTQPLTLCLCFSLSSFSSAKHCSSFIGMVSFDSDI